MKSYIDFSGYECWQKGGVGDGQKKGENSLDSNNLKHIEGPKYY